MYFLGFHCIILYFTHLEWNNTLPAHLLKSLRKVDQSLKAKGTEVRIRGSLHGGKGRFPLLHDFDVPRVESRRKIPTSPANSFSQFISSCPYCCCHISLLRLSQGSFPRLRVCSLARKGIALEVGWASRERGFGLYCVMSYFQINAKGKAPHLDKLKGSLWTSQAVQFGVWHHFDHSCVCYLYTNLPKSI